MVEVKMSEGLVVQVRVQEVEVVHSHDVICPCEQESEKDDSEDVPNGVCEGPVTRENPLFWNGEADRGVADEDVGLVHREVSSSEQLRELGFMETQRALPPVPGLEGETSLGGPNEELEAPGSWKPTFGVARRCIDR
ncbi:hypothetical protein V6N11_082609 [Hibiscus sabdariffa]